MELEGAVAVVTGASAGIGRATAISLAGAGADVVLAARRLEKLKALAEEIESTGRSALAVACDVSVVADVERLVEETRSRFGHVDVLVSNAGIPGGGSFERTSIEEIERTTATNYLGVLYCAKLFLPLMLERGRGHIVNVASLAGRFATPGASVYSATKHAVVAFSEALYYELQPKGILVTAVNPGFVVTEAFPHDDKPSWAVMQPERIAAVIVEVVRSGKAPEVSIPRWLASMQAFRVLTPPLYRAGVRSVSGRTAGPTSVR